MGLCAMPPMVSTPDQLAMKALARSLIGHVFRAWGRAPAMMRNMMMRWTRLAKHYYRGYIDDTITY